MTSRDRAIAAALVLSIAGSIGFAIAFVQGRNTQVLGLALTCVFAGFSIAALGWARWILPFEETVDLRDTAPSPVEDRAAQGERYSHGIAEITRKKWLVRMLYAALGVFGVAAIFPIGALGPAPDETLFHTRWKRGDRLQREDGTLVHADDLNVGAIETVYPEGSTGDYQSMAVIIRLPDGTGTNAVQGLVVYSKACTHAGCPVALYRAADQQLVCPCHQSIFDAADKAAVVSGPADHALPMLPIVVASDGYVRATGDFPSPVGPGFWENPA